MDVRAEHIGVRVPLQARSLLCRSTFIDVQRSVLDKAIMCCFLLLHDRVPFPNVNDLPRD